VYLIRKDTDVKKLIASHKETASEEEKTLNKYERIYLELNRDVRTDSDNIVHLQENVPSLFHLNRRNDFANFAFWINTDANPKGTVFVTFEASTPVEVYLSTSF